jgi:hypothetical protein
MRYGDACLVNDETLGPAGSNEHLALMPGECSF